MKTLQIELPEKLAQELEALVKEGWFRDESEAIRYAIKALTIVNPPICQLPKSQICQNFGLTGALPSHRLFRSTYLH